MVAMNEGAKLMRTLRHLISGVAPNVIAVSLVTESEQTIAVTLHRDIGTTLP